MAVSLTCKRLHALVFDEHEWKRRLGDSGIAILSSGDPLLLRKDAVLNLTDGKDGHNGFATGQKMLIMDRVIQTSFQG
jgi:hypothetical protein